MDRDSATHPMIPPSILLTLVLWMATTAVAQSADKDFNPAAGPLRVHPRNPRYFTDGSGRTVYLTGAHTWNNLVNMGRSDPPESFDFDAYLDFLQRHNHNFIRLWTWDSSTWDTRANGRLGHPDFVDRVAPLPWARTGPGAALDGGSKFDLHKFDDAYFDRLRSRTSEAGRRGIYVSVMLFEGWGLRHANRGRAAPNGWAWRSHPFHPENNVNGIDAGTGDGIGGRVHSLADPAVNEIQTAYLRKVVETVGDLDNVLYEVINEGGEKEWDWWVVKTVRDSERSRPKQHPIGITGHGAERLASMLESPADWISPGRNDGFGDDPPAWDGRKVSLLDTDHIWGVGGNPAWAWKSFVRGHNPLFMDPYDNSVLGTGDPAQWEPLRRSLGQTRKLADRLDLAAMTPHDGLATTKYCLAQPGVAYVVFVPEGGKVRVDLRGTEGTFEAEWIDPVEGTITMADPVAGGGDRTLTVPSTGAAVLYLQHKE